MKHVLRFAALLLLPGTVIINSCTKTPVNYPTRYHWPSVPNNPLAVPQTAQLPLAPLPPVRDSLSGHEFYYNNLTWQDDPVNVFIRVPDSYLFVGRGIEVFMDSASRWVAIPFYTFEYPIGTFPFPANNGYVYDNNLFDALYIFGIAPTNRNLAGTRIAIKVRVL